MQPPFLPLATNAEKEALQIYINKIQEQPTIPHGTDAETEVLIRKLWEEDRSQACKEDITCYHRNVKDKMFNPNSRVYREAISCSCNRHRLLAMRIDSIKDETDKTNTLWSGLFKIYMEDIHNHKMTNSK